MPNVVELLSGGIKSEREQTSSRICTCQSSLYRGCGKLVKKQGTRIVTLTWSRLEIKMEQSMSKSKNPATESCRILVCERQCLDYGENSLQERPGCQK